MIKFAGARKVLFLVDRNNLGRQTFKEFQQYRAPDDNRLFTELYNIQHLTSKNIDPVSKVCISTIQRIYSMLSDEEVDEEAEEYSLFEDVQKVSYEINLKSIANTKEVIKQSIENKKLLDKGRESFFSETVDVQITDVLYWSAFSTLFRLKYWILYKAYGKYEDGIGFQFADSKFMKAREMDIVRKAVDDEEYRKAILQSIEDSINKWSKEL